MRIKRSEYHSKITCEKRHHGIGTRYYYNYYISQQIGQKLIQFLSFDINIITKYKSIQFNII